jgi:hypothetical protein
VVAVLANVVLVLGVNALGVVVVLAPVVAYSGSEAKAHP